MASRGFRGRRLLLFIPVLLVGLALVVLLTDDTHSPVALTEAESRWLKSRNEIVFISQTSYPPFEFIDRNNRRQGMCLELASWIAAEFGFRIRFLDTTFKKAQQAVLDGRADVLTSFFYSKERDRLFDFTRVMWRIPAKIFVRSERPDIRGPEQLEDKRVAIQRGDFAREYLAKKKIRYTDIPCGSFSEAADLLIKGKADAVIGDEQIVLHYLYSRNLIKKVKRVGKPLYVGENCMAVREGEGVLRSILNKGIRLARQKGVFNRINLKWVGRHYGTESTWMERHRTDLIVFLVVLAATTVLIFIWNMQLQGVVRRRTRELAASEVKYRTLFEAAQDAVVIHEADGRILDVNAAFLEMYGIPDKSAALTLDILGDLTNTESDTLQSPRDLIRKALGGEAIEFEWPARRPITGEPFDVHVSLKRVSYRERDVVLATVKDITVQKQTERALLQAQKMEVVGNLAGGLAHDFNNILGGIVGPVSLLENMLESGKPLNREKMLGFLKLVDESGRRAADVVTELLSLSSRQTLSFRRMDLRDAVNRVVELSRFSFDKSIELDINLPDDPAWIEGDPTQIEQVLLNMFLNASHAMTIMRGRTERWHGNLTVVLGPASEDSAFLREHPRRKPGPYWALSITDTGVGIEPEMLGRIFDPFFTTKDKGTGSGLGLSMAFNIIDRHGGLIDVISEPGIGSVFMLYFPVPDEAPVEPGPEQKPETRTGEGRILIIDDEQVILSVARAMLEECGYTVFTAADAEKGIDLFRNRHKETDAVILDMVMPKLSGKEVFGKLREIDPDVPVLLASGFGEDERVRAVIRLGAEGFIHKPYSLEELSRAVADVLNGA